MIYIIMPPSIRPSQIFNSVTKVDTFLVFLKFCFSQGLQFATVL